MKIGIVVFPGTWSDRDCKQALNNIPNTKSSYLWHKDSNVGDVEAIILPGGFSHGDYLRAGAIAQFSPIMKEVACFAKKGFPILGICNGFQILCEAKLLPGTLIRNRDLKFKCCDTYLKSSTRSKFSSLIYNSQVLKIPISHGEGNYQAYPNTIKALFENDQVVFRYCSKEGYVDEDSNPNGSVDNIAGITNIEGNVLGMMPHPERSSSLDLGSEDGNLIFRSMVESFSQAV